MNEKRNGLNRNVMVSEVKTDCIDSRNQPIKAKTYLIKVCPLGYNENEEIRYLSLNDLSKLHNLIGNILENEGEVDIYEDRLLQQSREMFMGETFLRWAEEYFDLKERRNIQIARKDLFEDFCTFAPDQRKYCSPRLFKIRMKKYCEWKGWRLNPHLYSQNGSSNSYDKKGNPIIDDKFEGVEYFTIGDENFKMEEHG